MKTQEQADLDVFIATHAMGWELGEPGLGCKYSIQGGNVYIHERGNYVRLFSPTTDQSDTLMVLERCVCKTTNLEIDFHDGDMFTVGTHRMANIQVEAEADTLKMAISKFAKKLFVK